MANNVTTVKTRQDVQALLNRKEVLLQELREIEQAISAAPPFSVLPTPTVHYVEPQEAREVLKRIFEENTELFKKLAQ